MDLYQGKSTPTADEDTEPVPASGNLGNLINQLGGNSSGLDMNSIQQIMPLLMKLMNNQNSTAQSNEHNCEKENQNHSGEKRENNNQSQENKKKIYNKKEKRGVKEEENLDWSRLNL